MNQRLRFAAGISAAALDALALMFFGAWLSRTDWMFSHYSGPPELLLSAMWAGVGGLLATATWLVICFRDAVRAPHDSESRSRRPWLTWLFGIGLVLLCFPMGFIVFSGKSALRKSQWEADLKHLEQANVTVPELIQALRSDDYHRRWRAARAVTLSVQRNSPDLVPSDMPPQSSWPSNAVNVLADREHLPELVAALTDSLSGQDMIAWDSASALGSLGHEAESAVPALVAAIQRAPELPETEHETDTLRWRAAEALSQIRPSGIAALIKLLTDNDPAVRRQVVGQLGAVGPEARAAIPALEQSLKDEDDAVRDRARIALQRIDPTWKPSIDDK